MHCTEINRAVVCCGVSSAVSNKRDISRFQKYMDNEIALISVYQNPKHSNIMFPKQNEAPDCVTFTAQLHQTHDGESNFYQSLWNCYS